ncbi:NAD(P)H-binding protein [Bacillus tianshenii]|nr:NAD(P)H-binding protein [Bacillus tianshenii]
MKVLLLGATGRTGSVILDLFLKNNHSVHTLVRSPEKITETHKQMKIVEGNVLNAEDLQQAITGCEAVVSALNTDGDHTISASMPLIIEAMKKEGIKRVVTIGTAGILNSRFEEGKYRYETKESKRKSTRAAEDHRKGYELLKESDLDWTIVCPTYLPDGKRIGSCRAEKNLLPLDGKKIHVPDVAEFSYYELFNKDYLNSRVGIAY